MYVDELGATTDVFPHVNVSLNLYDESIGVHLILHALPNVILAADVIDDGPRVFIINSFDHPQTPVLASLPAVCIV